MTEVLDVYDFDKTIYAGDSSIDFWKFCLRHSPRMILRVPVILWSFFLYLLGVRTKVQCKETFFGFLSGIPDVGVLVQKFWETAEKKICPWFLAGVDSRTLIISASPEFLLRPVAEKLGVRLIASDVDPATGKFFSGNCYGAEKLRRFSAAFPDAVIGKFYSDSASDAPLAAIAQQAFRVAGEEKILWEEYRPTGTVKMKETFLSKDFLLFVFCGGMGTLAYFLSSLLISTQIDPTLSFVCGYGLSLFVTYGLTASLIFHEQLRLVRFGKFVLSYLPNILIQFLFVSIFLNIFQWNKVIVYALAVLVGLPITFLVVKYFAFGKILPKNSDEHDCKSG